MDDFLRMDRMPHIWCSTCGIGVSVNCFAKALEKCGFPLDSVVVVSGIGCTGRVAGYVKVDSFHTTHGRAIPFATGMKLANPKLKVVVFSGDGDLVAMTGGQVASTTPEGSILSTSPFGNFEVPYNLPFLAESVGAVYVARWTSLHVYNQTNSMVEALQKPGFSFIEIIAPCPTIFERQQRMGDGLDRLRWYCENSEIRNGANTKEADIRLRDKMIVGKFVDIERPTYLEAMNRHYAERLGSKYKIYEG
jgi:2-oxoglutarate ferredoxin oxidoreductase subunit beta